MSKTLNLAVRHRASDLVTEAASLLQALSKDRTDPEVLRAAAPHAIASLFGARRSGLAAAAWLEHQGLQEIVARIGSDDLGPAFDAGLSLLIDQRYPELAAHRALSYVMSAPDLKGLQTTNLDARIDETTGDETLEGGEAKAPVVLGDDGEVVSILVKSVIVRFSRHVMRTDAIEAGRALVTKVLAYFARREDAATLGRAVANPTLRDALALYNGTSGNDLGASATLTVTALSDGCGAMARQKGAGGGELGLAPRFLVVSPEKKFSALELVAKVTIPGSAAPLEVVATTRVPSASGAWFLFADPEQSPVLGAASLRGNGGQTVETRSRINFRSDAAEIKFTHTFGGAILGRLGTVRGGV